MPSPLAKGVSHRQSLLVSVLLTHLIQSATGLHWRAVIPESNPPRQDLRYDFVLMLLSHRTHLITQPTLEA